MHAYYIIYVLAAATVGPLCRLAYRVYAIRRTPKSRVTDTVAALNRPSFTIRLGRLGAVDVERDVGREMPQPRAVRSRQKSA